MRETENGNAGAGGRKREHPAQITTTLDHLSWEYALFKAGRISCQEPPQRQIPAEVLTIEEIWDILLMALPCHGRRFPLSGVNFWHHRSRKGVAAMVTWTELFAFCMLIVAIIALEKRDR